MSESIDNRKIIVDELFEFCQSDSLSVGGLREIIAKYGLTPNYDLHGNSDFNYEFFFEACSNERITEDIIQLLMKYFPHAPGAINDIGVTSLQVACYNRNMTANIIQKLIEAAPDSVRHVDEIIGDLPIHTLCRSDGNEIVKKTILELLLDKYPESIRGTNHKGDLPLHCAAYRRSLETCQSLIAMYPGSERIGTDDGELPLHIACALNSLSIVEYLYNLYPDAINRATSSEHYPIHYAVMKGKGRRSAALDIARFLLHCDPRVKLQSWKGESLLHWACLQDFDERGNLPIHNLCNQKEDQKKEKVATAILKLLLDKYPESIRHTNNKGNLPLHYACRNKSLEFCQLLVESYPDSVRVSGGGGGLPLHFATYGNTLATVEYFYKIYPDAVNHATPEGFYPIHWAMSVAMMRNNPKNAFTVQFLLDCDPRVKLQKYQSKSLFLCASAMEHTGANIEARIKVMKVMYDAYPEAIEDDLIKSSIDLWHQKVQAFINGEMIYARQARDQGLMTTTDKNGQLPLHRALQSNVRLGSIKLLVNGNLSAARKADNNGSIPLHLACQYHESSCVIQHLIDSCPNTLQYLDINHNTVLHYACRGANYSAIALLLDKYDATSVSMRNTHNELPMDLLFNSGAVEDRESIEYTDCVFRLLRAHPDTMMMKRVKKMG